MATRGVGIRVANKENGLGRISNHPESKVVGGGVFAHHSGSNDKEAPTGEIHFLGLTVFQDNEVERFAQLKIGVLTMRAMRFEVVNLGEDAAQAADIDRLGAQLSFTYKDREQGEDFLRASQGEGRDKDRAVSVEHSANRLTEPFNLALAGKAGRQIPVA